MPKQTTENTQVDITTISPKEFDIDNFYVKPIEDKTNSSTQYMAFPKYKNPDSKKDKDEPLYILTGNIKLTKGGIPKISEHVENDAAREFFWLGLDPEQPECVKLFDALQQIDDELGAKIKNNAEEKVIYEVKDKKNVPLTGLEYVPIVRETEEYTDPKTQKVYEPYKRIKVRFDTLYEEKKPSTEPSKIETAIYLGDNENPEPFTSVSDVEKVLRWNCEAVYVISVNKFWAMKAQKNKKRECGFSLKCHQVYITKEAPLTGQSTTEKFKKRLFAPKTSVAESPKQDSEEDTKKPIKKVQESEESEEEEKPTKKPVKKVQESEESEEEPVKKPAKKPVKKVSSDEESDSDDEPKKPVKKVVKKVSSDEESDSDDEPKKKPVKKTK